MGKLHESALPSGSDSTVAGTCLGDIAILASVLQEEFRWSLDSFDNLTEEEVHRAGAFMGRLSDAIAKIGWLADLGLSHIEGAGNAIKGDAAEWMLSPVGADTLRQVRQEGGAA